MNVCNYCHDEWCDGWCMAPERRPYDLEDIGDIGPLVGSLQNNKPIWTKENIEDAKNFNTPKELTKNMVEGVKKDLVRIFKMIDQIPVEELSCSYNIVSTTDAGIFRQVNDVKHCLLYHWDRK